MNSQAKAKGVVVILDCGATNVRAIAVDENGVMLANATQPNATVKGQERSDYQIWPLETIWEKISLCGKGLVDQLGDTEIAAIGVTTFGVDGTLVDLEGTSRYPIISWKCPRTEPVMENIGKYIDMDTLRRVTGLGAFPYNTIFKLLWLRENRGDLFDTDCRFLFISSLINHRLTGELTTDYTMLGTSMLTNRTTQRLSDTVMDAAGLQKDLFPPCVYPGDVIGRLTEAAAKDLGFNPGIKVVSCGHDTQFALFGSGAGLGEPVLSSGTWEILMVRARAGSLQKGGKDPEVTSEFDCIPGNTNLGVQWLASEHIEKLRHKLFADEAAPKVYETMMGEAGKTDRGKAYLNELKSLSSELKRGIEKLRADGIIDIKGIRVVGGGAKNHLWNQLKADTTGLPIFVLDTKETTVLGASFFAMAGAGVHSTPEAARDVFNY